MKWNSEKGAYFGTTSDGKDIRVEGDEIAESRDDLIKDLARKAGYDIVSTRDLDSDVYDALYEQADSEKVLYDPDMWETCIGSNENVEYVC